MAHGKIKPLWGKKSCWASASMQKPCVTGKNLSWGMTCTTYTMVCNIFKRKCLWRGRLFLVWHTQFVVLALLSHDDDLHLRETLSVQSYESCDSPRIMVIQTACLRDNHLYSLYQCMHQLCDHNFLRGFGKVSLVLPVFSYFCVCVQQKECWTSVPSLLLHHYTRWEALHS